MKLHASEITGSLSVSGSITPNGSGSWDLGSPNNPWKDLHVMSSSIHIYDSTGPIAKMGAIRGRGFEFKDHTGTLTRITGSHMKLTGNAKVIGSVTADEFVGGGAGITGVTAEWDGTHTGNGNITGTLTFGSLTDGTITIADFKDEDNMSSNSATSLPTQQSVKAYVDSQVTAQDLDATTDSGTIAIDLDSETLSIVGGNGIDTSATGNEITITGESATLTNPGIIEIATAAETNTGTDATRAVSPDALEDWEGSAQVTTLGTVTSGIWNAGAVTSTGGISGTTGTFSGAISVSGDITIAGGSSSTKVINLSASTNRLELQIDGTTYFRIGDSLLKSYKRHNFTDSAEISYNLSSFDPTKLLSIRSNTSSTGAYSGIGFGTHATNHNAYFGVKGTGSWSRGDFVWNLKSSTGYGSVASSEEVMKLEYNGNLTVAGTIGSGAITSTGLITGTDLTISGTSTTIGTVTSGIWNGTAINQTYLVGQSGTNTGDQSVFKTISVTGQDNVVADGLTDTLTLGAGTGITITNTAASDTIAFSIGQPVATDANVTFAQVTGDLVGDVTGNADTVTTNANLTGDVTSVGNATAIAAGVIINTDVKSDAAIAYSKLGSIPTWNQSTTGNAATATILASTRTIGGVSFNGSANINLPGVNATGNQDTSGNAATATVLETARTIGGVSFTGGANINLPGVNAAGNQNTSGTAALVTVTNSTTNANYDVPFTDGSSTLLEDDAAFYYNPSTGLLRVPNLSVAGTTTLVDTVTMEAANAVVFEGTTADDFETTLSIVDPTADHTQYLINQSGYVPLLAASTTTAITSTPAELNILDGVTSTAAELNILDGVTSTAAELNILDGVTSTAAELNILDGVTSTKDELNILDGVTSTAAEINILDGVTSTAAELNILDGVTSTKDELNILDGVTSTAAELNILDGVTSTATELNLLDGSIANTVVNSKGVVYGSGGEVTATNFTGSLSGNVTGNTSGTALTVTQAAQTAITSVGTLTTLTVDDITINGSTISDSGAFTLDVGSEITLDSDSGYVYLNDAGTSIGLFKLTSSDFYIKSVVSDKDIIFQGNDGGSTITALTLDMSAGGNATFAGKIDGNLGADLYAPSGTTRLLIHSAGSGGASDIDIDVAGGTYGYPFRIFATGGSNLLRLSTAGDVYAEGGGYFINPLGVGTNSPTAKLHAVANSTNSWTALKTSGQVYMYTSTGDGSELRYAFNQGGTTDAGYQYIYKADGSTIGINLNAGGDTYFNGGNVGIGTASPDEKLHVQISDASLLSGFGETGVVFEKNDSLIQAFLTPTDKWAAITFQDSSMGGGAIMYDHGTDLGMGAGSMGFRTESASVFDMVITSAGNVGIGVADPAEELEVKSSGHTGLQISSGIGYFQSLKFAEDDAVKWTIYGDSDPYELHIKDDGDIRMTFDQSGNVGIGTTTPGSKLSIRCGSSDSVKMVGFNESGGSDNFWIEGNFAGSGATGNYITMKDWSDHDIMTWLGDGNVGIGTTSPASPLHIYENTGAVDATAGLTIEQAGAGDAILQFLETGTLRWVMGLDNSDGDKFKIASDGDLNSNARLTIVPASGNVGIGTASPTQTLELAGDMRIQDARSLFFKRHGDNYAWRIRNESASDGSTYGFNGSNDLVFEVVSNSQTQATPAVESHTVYSTSANTLVLQEAGQVGIKVADPQYTLDVGGAINSTSSLRIKSANNSHTLMNLGYTTADNAYQDINWTHQSSATEVGVKLRFYQRPNGGELQIHTGRDGTLATAVTIGTLGSQNTTFAGDVKVSRLYVNSQLAFEDVSDVLWVGEHFSSILHKQDTTFAGNINAPLAIFEPLASVSADIEVLRIDGDSSGNMGIFNIYRNGANLCRIDTGYSDFNITPMTTECDIKLNWNSSSYKTAIRVDNSTGYVGIGNDDTFSGTTQPSYPLHVSVNATFVETIYVDGASSEASLIVGGTRGGYYTHHELGQYFADDGTGAQSQYPEITIVCNETATRNPQKTGISLHNKNTTATDTWSPMIAFSGKEIGSSGTIYDSQYAMIAGQDKGQSVNSDWRKGSLSFWTRGSTISMVQRARIDHAGNLLVLSGGSTDGEGSARTSIGIESLSASSSSNYIYIDTEGMLFQGGSTSDERMKKDFEALTGSLAKINNLSPISFKWKYSDEEDIGFTAQDVQSEIPLAVVEDKIERTVDDETFKPLLLEYMKLIPYMAGAIQELSAKVEALENE